MRWIFQILEGVGVVQFFLKKTAKTDKELIANLSDLRKRIIRFFRATACQLYGIF
jgi:hypothetical protein